MPSLPTLLWVVAATAAAPSAADPRAMLGVWEGTMTRIQAGRCSIAGQEKTVQSVRVIVRLDDRGQVVAAMGPLPAPGHVGYNVTIRVDGEKIFLDQPVTAYCGQNFRRKYVVKHDVGASIEPDGRRVLRLAGMDVPCIQSGCRFQQLIEVEFKGDVAPP
jgi:hypothetical protein